MIRSITMAALTAAGMLCTATEVNAQSCRVRSGSSFSLNIGSPYSGLSYQRGYAPSYRTPSYAPQGYGNYQSGYGYGGQSFRQPSLHSRQHNGYRNSYSGFNSGGFNSGGFNSGGYRFGSRCGF